MKGIEAQYGIKWEAVQGKINEMFKKIFQAAAAFEPPLGMSRLHNSVACYG